MPNLRIIYDNAADRATITTSAAGPFQVDNVKSDTKSLIYRSTGLSTQFTLSWSNLTTVGGIALPATNLSGSATVRVRLYPTADAQGAPSADSGTVLACPGNTLELWNWNLPLNANAFAFGGASKTTVWFNSHYTIRQCVIDIVDTTANLSGYIDCGRLVVGSYWEPKHNVQNGSMNIEMADLSTSDRTDGGDLLATRSVKHDKLRFDLAYLEELDRQQFMRIARLAGKSKNILVTVFPDNQNTVLAQDTTIYGKITNFATTQQFYGFYNIPI